MTNFVATLIEFLKVVFVHWFIVYEYEQGVWFRFGEVRTFYKGRGKNRTSYQIVPPGFYIKIPMIDKIEKQSTQMDTIDTDTITVMTTDGKAVSLSAILTVQVFDAVRSTLYVRDWQTTVGQYALAKMGTLARGHDSEFWRDPERVSDWSGTLMLELRKVVTADWGISIRKTDISHSVETDAKMHFIDKVPTVLSDLVDVFRPDND
jgi:hypothetical protein